MDELKQKVITYLEGVKNHPTALEIFIGDRGDTPKIVSKNETISEQARKSGNALFLQKNHNSIVHHKILQFYNRSIAYAPKGSELLATAYGNRSALLRHVRKYIESINEADQALKNTEHILLKVKLLCRKADCFTALGSSENRQCLEKARFLLAKSNDSEEMKEMISHLITQAQLIVDADKLDEPKKNWKKIESLRIIAEVEKSDMWSYIKIEYNKKYGRHLVAARDFDPGDVVLVEKPFMNHLDQSLIYMYCSHCWNYLWTVYPCDHCAWRLYCSEQCKFEALNGYHKTECSALVHMKEASLLENSCMIPFLVSSLVKATRQAGSLGQLERDLKSLDQCKDESKRKYPKNGAKEYISIYNLPFPDSDSFALSMFMGVSVLAMTGLAQYSMLFHTTYKSPISEIDKLKNDNAAVFATAFMVKMFMLTHSRSTNLKFFDPYEVDSTGKSENSKGESPYRYRGSFAIRSYGFHAVVGCVPNVTSDFTYNNRHVIYSLSPIKKGEPIVGSRASIYDLAPKAARQASYVKGPNFSCKCRACKEDWSEILMDDEHFSVSINASPLAMEMYEEIRKIDEEIETKSNRLNFPDAKILSKIRSFVARSWEQFPMPSMVTVRGIQNMMKLFELLHSPLKHGLEKIDSCKI